MLTPDQLRATYRTFLTLERYTALRSLHTMGVSPELLPTKEEIVEAARASYERWTVAIAKSLRDLAEEFAVVHALLHDEPPGSDEEFVDRVAATWESAAQATTKDVARASLMPSYRNADGSPFQPYFLLVASREAGGPTGVFAAIRQAFVDAGTTPRNFRKTRDVFRNFEGFPYRPFEPDLESESYKIAETLRPEREALTEAFRAAALARQETVS